MNRSAVCDRPDPAAFGQQNALLAALAGVDDPEYPGVSIVELGLLEAVRVDGPRVEVDLVPTFSGCPALAFIAADAEAAVRAVDGVDDVTVRFVSTPVWGPERIAPGARVRIAADFAVAVAVPGRPTSCPVCGAAALVEESMFGPVRCRSIRRCRACGERIETIR